jgi:hypothetical protein
MLSLCCPQCRQSAIKTQDAQGISVDIISVCTKQSHAKPRDWRSRARLGIRQSERIKQFMEANCKAGSPLPGVGGAPDSTGERPSTTGGGYRGGVWTGWLKAVEGWLKAVEGVG